MEITIKGRHWKPTPTFRDYAIERIEKLTRYYPRLIRAQLVVTRESYRHQAELHLKGNSIDLLAKSEDPDPRRALDTVLEKQERALHRRIEKMKDRKKHGRTVRLEAPAADSPRLPAATAPSIEVIRQRPRRPVLSADEAARTLLDGKKPVLVFSERGTGGLRVAYRLADGQVGLLELE